MNYGKIIYCDTANRIGCRTILFVSGCTHHCKGCKWKFSVI
ncbi:4Fe-4S cluster-binding domain-containing protein [Blautia wexlerae]